ncbi:uncharacterized protein KGF55_004908 [Candida pseudojiufengensis]|uniref:uncharacterized protein n=1 Tax=Candida pseudojiufengensis TaxID=497109 RepID=UPI002224DEA1|nr:uncharacterized protein KGF55_004908 [Candida pseudojiufengensis]KAI5960185.1 hypothetical protein KGF55_004908 [Candida pseudojiufengensis]
MLDTNSLITNGMDTRSSASVTTLEYPQQAIHSSSNKHQNDLENHSSSLNRNSDVPVRQFDTHSKNPRDNDNLNIALSQFEISEPDNENLRRRRINNHDSQSLNTRDNDLMYTSEKNSNQFPEGGKEANLVLIGSFMGLIADFGIPNTLGAIESYIESNQLKNINKQDIGWVFALYLGIMYLFNVIFGQIFDMYGAKIPLCVGTFLICIGLFLTAECEKLYQFILSFSIITALGCSIAMSPLIGALSHWYLRKRAMACSIATIGGLVGASIFSIMLQQLYDKIGFKNAIRVLSCICFFCMSCSIILVKGRHQDDTDTGGDSIENSNDTNNGDIEIIEEGNQIEQSNSSLTSNHSSLTRPNHASNSPNHQSLKFKLNQFLKEALDFSILKDIKFVSLTIAVFLAEIVSMTTITYLGSYALAFNLNNQTAYLILTIVNICGIPSRLLSGIIADKFGRFNIMIITSILTTIIIFGFWLPAKSKNLLIIFSIFFGISSSAVLSLIPSCTGQICSSEKFGKIYGTLYFCLGFLTILGMYLVTLVIDKGNQLNYRNFVLFEGFISFFSVLVWIWARYSSVGWKWCKF